MRYVFVEPGKFVGDQLTLPSWLTRAMYKCKKKYPLDGTVYHTYLLLCSVTLERLGSTSLHTRISFLTRGAIHFWDFGKKKTWILDNDELH